MKRTKQLKGFHTHEGEYTSCECSICHIWSQFVCRGFLTVYIWAENVCSDQGYALCEIEVGS